jgi:hypothetical protein
MLALRRAAPDRDRHKVARVFVAVGVLLAVALVARRFPAAGVLCVAALGWALSTDRIQPAAEIRGPLHDVRAVWTGAQAATEARMRCSVLTRRALAAGPDELEAAVTAAERACPSAGDPLRGR